MARIYEMLMREEGGRRVLGGKGRRESVRRRGLLLFLCRPLPYFGEGEVGEAEAFRGWVFAILSLVFLRGCRNKSRASPLHTFEWKSIGSKIGEEVKIRVRRSSQVSQLQMPCLDVGACFRK